MKTNESELTFLNEISHDLLSEADNEIAINRLLVKLLDYFNGNRVYIFEFDYDQMLASNTYEVCAAGVKSEKETLQNLPMEIMNLWIETFEKKRFINVESVSGLDESRSIEKEMLSEQGIESLVAVSLERNDKLIGFIGIDDPKRSQNLVERFDALGDYIVLMLMRRDTEAKMLDDAKNLRTLMDDTPGGFARIRVYPDGRASKVFVNGGYNKLLGLSGDEALEEDVFSRIHPDDIELVKRAIGKTEMYGEMRRVKYRLRKNDGEYVWLLVFGRASIGSGGEKYLNVYYEDLTEEEKREMAFRDALPFILEAIMKSSNDLSFAKDTDYVYTCCSAAFATFAGKNSIEEVIGKTDYDLFEKPVADQFRHDDEYAMNSGESIIDKLEPIPSNDGVTHYSRTSKYILRDTYGKIIGIYGTGRDITQYRTAFDQLQLLTNNIPGGIAMVQVNKSSIRIIYSNEGFYTSLGYNMDEFQMRVREDPLALVEEADKQILSDTFHNLEASGESTADCTYRCVAKDGKCRFFNMKGIVSERRVDSIIVNVVQFDITEQKMAEYAILAREEEQRQKLHLLKEINTANRANRAKSDFLSRMSHDIRTPLNAILVFSGDEMTRGESAEELQSNLDKIHLAGDYLLGIINDVLEMSRIEQKKIVLRPEPYLMEEFIATIWNVIGELSKDKAVNFSLNFERCNFVGVVVDKVRFNQVFMNLLSNAIKFTPSGGMVEFSIESKEPLSDDKAMMHFEVQDNGIGMDKEFVPHAFDSFAQEYREDVTDKTQGTGLGLSIVKEIITMMDGKISVQSVKNEGTTFRIDIPLVVLPDSTPKKKYDNILETDIGGYHILLCEDNDLNIEIATKLLSRKGCYVDVAKNGKEGLDMYKASPDFFYDAVLMDIRMPIMDGNEATKWMRFAGREDSRKMPILAMTADAFTEDKQSSCEAGMDDLIAKPINPKELYEILNKYVSKYREG